MRNTQAIADAIVYLIYIVGFFFLGYFIFYLITKKDPLGLFKPRPVSQLFQKKSSKEIYTVDGFWGTKVHYDQDKNIIGTSTPGFQEGTMMHFDAEGNFVGVSEPGIFEGQVFHNDAHGHHVGVSISDGSGSSFYDGMDGKHAVTTDGPSGMQVTEIYDE